jgi:hypothetical protein
MRVLPAISLIVLAGVFSALSILEPEILAENQFLKNFINYNYVSILTVIVTVSLVSITQINLEYSRVERRFGKKVFQKPRSTLNLSAFLLVAILLVGILLAFLRAHLIDCKTAVSFIHSIAILSLLEVVFIMYDLIKSVYALAEDEPVDD